MKFTPIFRLIARSKLFNRAILGLILLGAVLVGLETSPVIFNRHADLIKFAESLILFLFVIEISIRILAYGRAVDRYFRDPWNLFDFTVVFLCLLPAHYEFLLVFRLARIFRVVTIIPKLRVMAVAFMRSTPSFGYVFVLLILQFYVYGVTGVFLFGENDPIHFTSLPIALLSLFRVMTLEDWTDIMYTQMYGSDQYAAERYVNLLNEPAAFPLLAPLYFVSFVLIATMIILNLFISLVMNGMNEINLEAERRELEEHKRKGIITLADEIKLLDHQLDELKEGLQLVLLRAEKARRRELKLVKKAAKKRQSNTKERSSKELRIVGGGK